MPHYILLAPLGNAILGKTGSTAEIFTSWAPNLYIRQDRAMVDITPEANIFGIFRNLNYKPWYALAEFVDNSIASWEKWDQKLTCLPKPAKVRVELVIENSFPSPFIEIRDNSSGIKFEDFGRAFKVASIPEDASSLNEFGMGMKTAGFWFANSWSVRTSYAGEPLERTMNFNLSEILKNQTTEIAPLSSAASAESHFTTVRLTELNQTPKGRTVAKIREHLTGMYRQFIRDGVLELYLNGEELEYEEVEVLLAPKVGAEDQSNEEWKKTIDFHIPEGGHVKGFVAIRNKGNTTHAGLALLRKRRLIEGSADETWRPQEIFGNSNSYSYQRIFGELNLTDFKVTHTKDAIKWNEGQKESFLKILQAELKSEPLNLLAQAEKYRVRGNPPPKTTLDDAMEAVSDALELSLVDAIDRVNPEQTDIEEVVPDIIASPVTESVEKTFRLKSQSHGMWNVKLIGFSDPAVTDFFRLSSSQIGQGSENSIEVQVNLAHTFASQYLGPNHENLELLLAFTAHLCVALSLGKQVGAKSGYIIDFLNQLLRIGE